MHGSGGSGRHRLLGAPSTRWASHLRHRWLLRARFCGVGLTRPAPPAELHRRHVSGAGGLRSIRGSTAAHRPWGSRAAARPRFMPASIASTRLWNACGAQPSPTSRLSGLRHDLPDDAASAQSVRIHGADVYNPFANCKRFLVASRREADVEPTEYLKAKHGFDNPLAPRNPAPARDERHQSICESTIRQADGGNVVNDADQGILHLQARTRAPRLPRRPCTGGDAGRTCRGDRVLKSAPRPTRGVAT